MRPAPGLVVGLRPQQIPNGVADCDQAADDSGVLCGNPLTALRRSDRDRPRDAVDDLHELAVVKDIASFLDRRAFSGRPNAQRRVRRVFRPRRCG